MFYSYFESQTFFGLEISD